VSRRIGFEVVRARGSHPFPRHADGRCTTVPVPARETIGPGLRAAILRDGEIARNEFAALFD
jgi:predicted RNA binding protein YcfA (HicA-like mRNA interferase family)